MDGRPPPAAAHFTSGLAVLVVLPLPRPCEWEIARRIATQLLHDEQRDFARAVRAM